MKVSKLWFILLGKEKSGGKSCQTLNGMLPCDVNA